MMTCNDVIGHFLELYFPQGFDTKTFQICTLPLEIKYCRNIADRQGQPASCNHPLNVILIIFYL